MPEGGRGSLTTILFLLDAFRYDYLSEDTTPFLWRCSNSGEYYQTLKQSLGFCERSEILTGLSGNESGYLTAIGFDPENSPYSDKNMLLLLDWIERAIIGSMLGVSGKIKAKIHRRCRSYLSKFFKSFGITMSPYMIPLSWLKYFSLTEDTVDYRDMKSSRSSILKLLSEAGKTFFYDSFTALGNTPYSSDQERLKAIDADLTKDEKDLYLVYISMPDTFGHSYGPDSREFKLTLLEMDAMLERFVLNLEKKNKNRYLFVGDHGMSTVISKIDVEKELKLILGNAGLIRGKDYIYFLDSTMVRLWSLSAKVANNDLKECFKNSSVFRNNGIWLDKQYARKYKAPWPDRRYGDFLWVANSGVLVFPDYFHVDTPCKGMHGYDPSLPESKGMCILWGDGIVQKTEKEISLNEVYGLLKYCLDL